MSEQLKKLGPKEQRAYGPAAKVKVESATNSEMKMALNSVGEKFMPTGSKYLGSMACHMYMYEGLKDVVFICQDTADVAAGLANAAILNLELHVKKGYGLK